jgi:hypothetical protein
MLCIDDDDDYSSNYLLYSSTRSAALQLLSYNNCDVIRVLTVDFKKISAPRVVSLSMAYSTVKI